MRAALAVLVLVGLCVPAVADGYRVSGRAWPGGKVSVYNATPYRHAVRDAMRVWNRSGVRVRFTSTYRRRGADLVIALGGERVRSASGGCAGSATVGWLSGRQARMRLFRGCADDALTSGVVVHELGHVLGLGHERRRCAQMNTFFVNGIPNRCDAHADPVAGGTYRCRMLERDDLNGARRLYGGRGRVRGGEACPIFAPPRTARSLTVGVDAFGAIALTYRTPGPRRIARVAGAEDPLVEVRYARAQNRCDGVEPRAGTPARWDAGGTIYTYETLPPGRWCYAVWLVDALGRRSPPLTKIVTINPDLVPHLSRIR